MPHENSTAPPTTTREHHGKRASRGLGRKVAFLYQKDGERGQAARGAKGKAGQEETGPKLEQEAMFINNPADPQAPDTKCIRYCWDTALPLTGGAERKRCWEPQSLREQPSPQK